MTGLNESESSVAVSFDGRDYTFLGVLINQVEVADIYEGVQGKAQHKYRIFYVDGVTEEDETADQRYEPERGGDVGFLFVFADYPLKHETSTKYQLSYQGNRSPNGVAYYLLGHGAFYEFNYRTEHNFSPKFW